MPLYTADGPSSGRDRFCAVVAIPAFNATGTIESTLASVVESIRHHRRRGGERVAISVVDDASTDRTVEVVREFGNRCDEALYLAVHALNRGRAAARNRAVSAVDADYYLFLDHDDVYLPEHIHTCVSGLSTNPLVAFVKTEVVLSDPVHPDWQPRIAASLTQNLAVRGWCHQLMGGFHEAVEIERFGNDDQVYNRTLRALFRGLDIPTVTVRFQRYPGNSFDRQYERKFVRSAADAEVTPLAARAQRRSRILGDARLQEVRARFARLASISTHKLPVDVRRSVLTHSTSSPAISTPAPFGRHGERIHALMVTGKSAEREQLARLSIASFLGQDYGNRALVIVNHGDFDLDVSDVPPDRVIQHRLTGTRSLGELRNIGLEAIPDGALWTYWDDDDWHHPSLLTRQHQVMTKLKVEACLLRNQVKYGFSSDAAFADHHRGGFAATLLSRKRPGCWFASLDRSEDSAYWTALKSRVSWYPWNNPAHYFLRFFHGSNSWDAKHFGFSDAVSGAWDLGQTASDYLRAVIPLYRDCHLHRNLRRL